MSFLKDELTILYKYFGLKNRTEAKYHMENKYDVKSLKEWKEKHKELFDAFEKCTSHNYERPTKLEIKKKAGRIDNYQLAKFRDVIEKRSFVDQYFGTRQLLIDFRKNYEKIKVNISGKELENEITLFKEDVFIDNLEIFDNDSLLTQINDYFTLLLLKWNNTSKSQKKIFFAKAVFKFEHGENKSLTIAKKLTPNLQIDYNEVRNQLNELEDNYEALQDDVFLKSMHLYIYYGPNKINPSLYAYATGLKKTKNALFSPIIFKFNCCICEVACFLKFNELDFVKNKEYIWNKKTEWMQLNISALTSKIFNEDIKYTFFTGDIKQFVLKWNEDVQNMDIVLYNSVTQEYFPIPPIANTKYVLFWYPYHIEVFEPAAIEKIKPSKFKLKPIETEFKKNEYVICTIDFETYCLDKTGTQIPYLICIHSKEFTINFSLKEDNDILMELMIFFKDLDKKKRYIFWAHNGMKFDYLFMMPYIVKCFNARIKGKVSELKCIEFGNIRLLDFYKFFNTSLNNLSKSFLGKQKMDFDFKRVFDKESAFINMEEAIKYCKMDCELLFELVLKFDNSIEIDFNLSINDCFSASHLAKIIFHKNYLTDTLMGSIEEDYNIEKSSYHGGLCMSYAKGVYNKKIYVYDVNSSYPYAMMEEMPYKFIEEKELSKDPRQITKHYLYKIEFEFPTFARICNLGMKIENELVFLQQGKGWFWGCELLTAEKLGAKFVFQRVRKYNAKAIFREYITDMYAKRLQAKKDKNEILIELYKKLLNSLYGKFGQKLHSENYIEKYEMFMENKLQINDLHLLSDDCIYVEYFDFFKQFNSIGGLVRFSSYISAISKCTLLEPIVKINQDQILYMDTDSLFLTKELDEKWLDNFELGKFKKEEYDGGIFICAKNYMLFPNIMKMKGVNTRNLTRANYEDIINKCYTFVNTSTSKKEFGCVKIFEINKLITGFNYKRISSDFYNYPHANEIDFFSYKKKQITLRNILKKQFLTSSKPIKNELLAHSNFIKNSIDNCNMSIVFNHSDKWNDFSKSQYLKYRIMGFNPCGYNNEVKDYLYKKLIGVNVSNEEMRIILLEMYGMSCIPIENIDFECEKLDGLKKKGFCMQWNIKDLGMLKKMFVDLQFDYLRLK